MEILLGKLMSNSRGSLAGRDGEGLDKDCAPLLEHVCLG